MEKRKNLPSKDEKTVEMAMLLDFYGELLSEGQRQAMDYFYGEDLSLGEIAQIAEITRQGVRDRIVKGEKALLQIEERLGLVKRFSEQRLILSKTRDRLEEIKAHCPGQDEQIDGIVSMIETLL